MDPWTTLFWRSVFATASLLAYLLWRDGRGGVPAAFRRLGWAGAAMAVCFATSMMSFIYALSLTTVAAVLIFQAAAPLIAAALAWAFLGERVAGIKLAAIVVSFIGVLVIVAGVPNLGSLWGVLVSALCGVSYAGTVVLARARPDVPTTEATVVALLIVGALTGPFAAMTMPPSSFGLLAVFGTFQMGLALIMFTTGVRLIPAADAGLISVLESALGPLLVWLAFGEVPGATTLAGGAVILAAVIVAAKTERRLG
jgi:drug/metabolite transporter (DMT)-like permease